MKKKGFTLIELLAVVVILAVVALIAIPGILNIIYKAKLSAAEDSTLGVVQSANNYIGNFVLKNDGTFPSGGLTFVCVGGGCSLETNYIVGDYELNGLMQLNFENLEPSGGTITVDSDGKSIIVEDLLIGDFVCNYPVDGTASCIDKAEVEKNRPLIEPIFELNPRSGWSQSKDATLTFNGSGTKLIITTTPTKIDVDAIGCEVYNQTAICKGEKIPSGGILQSGKWYKVTSNPTLTYLAPGSLNYKITNGVSYIESGALTITGIDRTPPELTFTTSVTTNSITVTANGTDSESGISGYQFSKDNGATWLPATPQASNSYTFNGLTSGNYNIKVRVINGTYANNGQNSMNTTESAVKSVATASLTTPTGKVNQSGWSQSKTTTITYTGEGTYLLRPSVAVTTNIAATTCSNVNNGTFTCNGAAVAANGTLVANTWYRVTSSPTLTFTSAGSVSIKIADGVNYKDGSATTVSYIDRTAPISSTVASTSATTNSITVTASGADAESGISRYQFSKDNGATWLPATPQASTSYTFSSLTSGNYNIKVRVINGTFANNGQNSMNTTESAVKGVATASLATPAGKVNQSGWTQSKTATITYSGSGTYLLRPSVAVTTNIAATTCSSVSNGTFTCNGAAVGANGTLAANTWYRVTSSPTLTFTSAGSVSIKVADGVNYKDGSATTVSYIDRTAPTSSTVASTSATTNSITVTASGADAESGISRYQFSKDNGATWLPATPQASASYTFSNVTSGSYNVKVRVINGTYPNINQINNMNSTVSAAKPVTTASLTTPTGKVNQSGWTQSKTATITYSGSGTYLLRPSVAVTTNIAATTCSSVSNGAFTCNGAAVGANGTLAANTWYRVTSSPTLTFTSAGSVSIKVADGVNYKDGSATTVSYIDRTVPTSSTVASSSATTNSITVTASGADAESGISRYQFSKDNGATWLPATPQTSTSYTFSSLASGTSYNIKVRVINGTYPNINQINNMNSTVSAVKPVTTTSLTTPTGKVNQSGWTQSKTATITYSGSGTYLLRPSVAVTTNIAATTCSSVSNGTFTCNGAAVGANGTLAANTWYRVTSSPTLTFTSAGSVSIKVADGVNYKDGSAVNVTQIDRTAPNINSFTATSSGSSVQLVVSATDSESGISRYEFYVTLSGVETQLSGCSGNTCKYNLPTGPYASKDYTNASVSYRVKVYNNAGLSSGSTYSDTCTTSPTVCTNDMNKTTTTCKSGMSYTQEESPDQCGCAGLDYRIEGDPSRGSLGTTVCKDGTSYHYTQGGCTKTCPNGSILPNCTMKCP